jgi:hypothetical protein
MRAALPLLAGIFLIPLAGCTSMMRALSDGIQDDDPYGPPAAQRPDSPQRADSAPYRTPDEISAPLSPDEKAVVASADTLIGMAPESRVVVNGRTFVLDCIGTVSAIFYGMDIDVQKDFPRYRGDGVSRLFQSLAAHRALHHDRLPRPGDVVFWDNTWDANGDGRLDDDPLTHAGVVMSVDPDGTIHYVHEHIIKGVTVEAMNLRRPFEYSDPQGRIINNAMALNSGISRWDNPPHWTSGDLWDSFGDVLRVRKYFEVAVWLPGTDREETVLVALRPPDPQ